MKLSWISINKYKNLDVKKIEFNNSPSGVYVLVGKNGSGKSNLLEAISLIFSSLYIDPYNAPFEYDICYEINGKIVKIKFELNLLSIKVNEVDQHIEYLRNNSLLPNRVVAVYSGEELRMWESIYKPFYDKFIESLIYGNAASMDLMYINKYHWNIALLTLALSETDACKDFISEINYNIKNIDFSFDYKKIKDNSEPLLQKFLDIISTKQQYTIDELRVFFKTLMYGDNYEDVQLNDYDVFEYLQKANIPKHFKTISNIKINLDGGLSINELSEGEKKKILIFTVMQVLASQDSIVLLDEPDSFLHPTWQKSLTKYIDSLTTNQFVLYTTHSPNVISGTNNSNVIRIQNGVVLENTPATRGRDISSIQYEIMDEGVRDNEVAKEIDEIYGLISKGDLDVAEEAVNKLMMEKMGPNDTEIIKIKTMIEFEKEFR